MRHGMKYPLSGIIFGRHSRVIARFLQTKRLVILVSPFNSELSFITKVAVLWSDRFVNKMLRKIKYGRETFWASLICNK